MTVGKWYEIRGKFRFSLDDAASDTTVFVDVTHNSTVIDRPLFQVNESTDTVADRVNLAISTVFQAEATTLTFVSNSCTANSSILGNNTREETYIQLEERNDLRETDKF